jgi:hypothetical protein
MEIEFYNNWVGNSLKPGGACPISVFELYLELNPGYMFLFLTIFNFSVGFSRKTPKKSLDELFKKKEAAGE